MNGTVNMPRASINLWMAFTSMNGKLARLLPSLDQLVLFYFCALDILTHIHIYKILIHLQHQ
jgi:hypothetical protein